MKSLSDIAEDLAVLGTRAGPPDKPLQVTIKGIASGLMLEAKAEIAHELGQINDFSLRLAVLAGALTVGGHVVEAATLVQSAIRQIERTKARPSASALPNAKPPYVSLARIAELTNLRSPNFDFIRLVELCRELNVAASNDCHMATGFLLRTILNHVPPIFGHEHFAQVAANYSSVRSIKPVMVKLQEAPRNSADFHLHQPIRRHEVLPTFAQVAFSSELDTLLGEVVRVTKEANAATV